VIGKHELITYAVGIGSDGAVRGVEILDYRETRGGEVRDPRWRDTCSTSVASWSRHVTPKPPGPHWTG